MVAHTQGSGIGAKSLCLLEHHKVGMVNVKMGVGECKMSSPLQNPRSAPANMHLGLEMFAKA